MARLFAYLAGPHGSPLMFLPATNPQPLPKFPLTSMLGGLHPSLDSGGERRCGNEFGCGGPKRTKVVSIQREHTEGGGGNDGTKERDQVRR